MGEPCERCRRSVSARASRIPGRNPPLVSPNVLGLNNRESIADRPQTNPIVPSKFIVQANTWKADSSSPAPSTGPGVRCYAV
jgi:hypothetical protein